MINQALLFILTLYMHIIDDYCLQGVLANMKQKSWWKEHAPDKLYKDDWTMALSMHAMSWATSISIPMIAYSLYMHEKPRLATVLILWPVNSLIHCIVDDAKCNKKKISLWADQEIHLAQITFTCMVCDIVQQIAESIT